jgi:hypothetical protein
MAQQLCPVNPYSPSSEEIALSNQMMDYRARFAATTVVFTNRFLTPAEASDSRTLQSVALRHGLGQAADRCKILDQRR